MGRGERAVPRPTRPPAARVQAPVDVFLDDLTFSVNAFEGWPTVALDGFLAVEFPVEVLRENEILPESFETAFESPLEYLGLREAASLRDVSNPIGNFGGHTA